MPCSFSLQLIFFSEQPFYGNYSTLDSNTNTVISHAFDTRQDGVENRDKVYCFLGSRRRRHHYYHYHYHYHYHYYYYY